MAKKPKPINPFEAAKRRSGVHVELEVHDVRTLRPDLNDEQAKLFLDRNAKLIADTMLIAGACALRELLEEYKP